MDSDKKITAALMERATGVPRATYRSWQARNVLSFAGEAPGPGVAQTFTPMAAYEAGFIAHLVASAGIPVSVAAAVFRAATIDNHVHSIARRLSGGELPEFAGFEHRNLDAPTFLVFVATGGEKSAAYGTKTWVCDSAAALGDVIAGISREFPRVGFLAPSTAAPSPGTDVSAAEEITDRRNARFPAVKDFHVVNLTALLVEIDAELTGIDPLDVWEQG